MARALNLVRFLIGVGALPATSAFAALPPLYQQQREVERIRHSGDVAKKLENRPIDRVERLEKDHYRVFGGSCVLEVTIVDDPAAASRPYWY
jgi:hypothetical protein